MPLIRCTNVFVPSQYLLYALVPNMVNNLEKVGTEVTVNVAFHYPYNILGCLQSAVYFGCWYISPQSGEGDCGAKDSSPIGAAVSSFSESQDVYSRWREAAFMAPFFFLSRLRGST